MVVKAIILAAGNGKRMNSDLPKVLHKLGGKPMVQHVLETVQSLTPEKIIVVIGPGAEDVKAAVAPYTTVVQEQRLGTAHAALAAQNYLEPFEGQVLVLFGDNPLITPQTLKEMLKKAESGVDIVVLGFIPADARRYGRLVMGDDGLQAIVEYKDATEEQRAIQLCNSGVMCLNGQHILKLLREVKNENAAGEYYLTDVVKLAKERGLSCDVVIGNVEELHGVNTQEELEMAEELYQRRLHTP